MPVRARLKYGFTLWGYLPDTNFKDHFLEGTIKDKEEGFVFWLIKNAKKGDVFWDCGANYGFYSALCNSLGIKQYAFEPSKRVFPFLRWNVRRAYNFALSDRVGEAMFSDELDLGISGTSSIVWPSQSGKTYVVKTETVDHLVETKPLPLPIFDPPSIMKIDVEGAERLVLKGAKHTIAAFKPVIMMEYHTLSPDHDKALEFLAKVHYAPHIINNDGSLEKTTFEHIQSSTTDRWANYLFMYHRGAAI